MDYSHYKAAVCILPYSPEQMVVKGCSVLSVNDEMLVIAVLNCLFFGIIQCSVILLAGCFNYFHADL